MSLTSEVNMGVSLATVAGFQSFTLMPCSVVYAHSSYKNAGWSRNLPVNTNAQMAVLSCFCLATTLILAQLFTITHYTRVLSGMLYIDAMLHIHRERTHRGPNEENTNFRTV